MGVVGLKDFFQRYNLMSGTRYIHSTKLIVDANLLQYVLLNREKHGFKFGGNLVLYRQLLKSFVDNLRMCKIEPIFVFDGAQIEKGYASKTDEIMRRCTIYHEQTIKLSETGQGSFVPSPLATVAYKGILLDLKVTIVQAFYEADQDIARLARRYQCPVLSNDSDFLLMDLPNGVIPLDSFCFDSPSKRTSTTDGDYYLTMAIKCSIFFVSKLVKTLKIAAKTLPLLGPLIGNDFVPRTFFENFCKQLPKITVEQVFGSNYIAPEKFMNNHARILRVLSFLRNLSLEQAINHVCDTYPAKERDDIRECLNQTVKLYQINENVNFVSDMYQYIKSCLSPKMEVSDKEIANVSTWLQIACENTTITNKSLEIFVRNKLFFEGTISDLSLPSPIFYFTRIIGILARFMRMSNRLNKPVLYYDRRRGKYHRYMQIPIRMYIKEGEGLLKSINIKLFGELTDVDELLGKKIMCGAFLSVYKDRNKFYSKLSDLGMMPPYWAEQITYIKMLFNYIDKRSKGYLWGKFKIAVLVCHIYHMHREFKDELTEGLEFMQLIKILDEKYELQTDSSINNDDKFNIRIVHQISQLQVSILAYETMNGILGEPLVRLKPHLWFNSCFIYNLTRLLKFDELYLNGLYPYIIKY